MGDDIHDTGHFISALTNARHALPRPMRMPAGNSGMMATAGKIYVLTKPSRKCGINYRIVAGTLLGAVRHGGFIPWDDDADVAFLREEYEQFRAACETEPDTSRFYFQDHRNTPGYRWGYGKLRRKGTEFIRLNQEHMPYEQGIFIDIFPYDCVPDFYPARLFHALRCFIYRKTFWAPAGNINVKGISKLMYITVGKSPLRE